MMYGWIEWRGLRASRQGWTPWTLQDRQGRQSADASFELLFFLEEGCDCSYYLQGFLVTGRQYHGVQILITHYEVKAGQNLPAYPDDPLYFRQNLSTFDLTFIFTIALPALIQALDDIAGQSLHLRPILIFSSTFDSFYWWSWSGQSELHNVKHFAETSIWTVHPVARWSPMLGEDHFARSWVWAGYI